MLLVELILQRGMRVELFSQVLKVHAEVQGRLQHRRATVHLVLKEDTIGGHHVEHGPRERVRKHAVVARLRALGAHGEVDAHGLPVHDGGAHIADAAQLEEVQAGIALRVGVVRQQSWHLLQEYKVFAEHRHERDAGGLQTRRVQLPHAAVVAIRAEHTLEQLQQLRVLGGQARKRATEADDGVAVNAGKDGACTQEVLHLEQLPSDLQDVLQALDTLPDVREGQDGEHHPSRQVVKRRCELVVLVLLGLALQLAGVLLGLSLGENDIEGHVQQQLHHDGSDGCRDLAVGLLEHNLRRQWHLLRHDVLQGDGLRACDDVQHLVKRV
mmetsp:Transcript_51386/g.128939  ORF Transcript_51386/g.128939 Transcript_51386/m.128939 type:complete len:326 (-) Transcript_51386:425-1402(-)